MLRNHKIFEVRPQPKRRAVLVAAAGCTLGVLPIAARAQAKKAPVVIGWIEAGSPETSGREFALFKEGLANLGLRDGAQIQIEPRWLRGRSDQIAALTADLAMNKPAVIVTSPRNVTVAVAKSVPGVPLVQAWGGSLVSVGLAASLARPGGLVAGLVNLSVDLVEKRTELLRDTMPSVERVG